MFCGMDVPMVMMVFAVRMHVGMGICMPMLIGMSVLMYVFMRMNVIVYVVIWHIFLRICYLLIIPRKHSVINPRRGII